MKWCDLLSLRGAGLKDLTGDFGAHLKQMILRVQTCLFDGAVYPVMFAASFGDSKLMIVSKAFASLSLKRFSICGQDV